MKSVYQFPKGPLAGLRDMCEQIDANFAELERRIGELGERVAWLQVCPNGEAEIVGGRCKICDFAYDRLAGDIDFICPDCRRDNDIRKQERERAVAWLAWWERQTRFIPPSEIKEHILNDDEVPE